MQQPHNKKVGLVIGRFQGYHSQHHKLIKQAALENDMLLVLVGSRNRRVSIKNPFTFDQRVEMIENNIKADHELKDTRIIFRAINDDIDNRTWADWVWHNVHQFTNNDDCVTIYGCDKDSSTFYLKMFPQWKLKLIEHSVDIDATRVRNAWFNRNQHLGLCQHVPIATSEFLCALPYNADLQEEWEFYQNERKRFQSYPYPETLTFNCGDAVVTWNDYVLMIRRKHAPGKGCLALPGGFKNRDETFLQAAIRELYEETRININPNVLMDCYKRDKLFDDPSRSIGIPRATLAVHFDVTYSFDDFPDTYPADDASETVWVKVDDLKHLCNIYDDHASIVQSLVIYKGKL